MVEYRWSYYCGYLGYFIKFSSLSLKCGLQVDSQVVACYKRVNVYIGNASGQSRRHCGLCLLRCRLSSLIASGQRKEHRNDRKDNFFHLCSICLLLIVIIVCLVTPSGKTLQRYTIFLYLISTNQKSFLGPKKISKKILPLSKL